MIPAPNNVAELSQILAAACAKKDKVERVNLSALNRVVEHTPEDMTVTVEAGATLASLQTRIGQHRQWLALDPPHPETATIADIINANTSGPRRFGYGTIRDFLIGLTAVLADGTVIHSGGKVVKNVAGYDLMKLFIGGHGSLGVVVEATFKLRPLPELEQFVSVACKSLEQADQLIETVIKSEVTPIVLDLCNFSTNMAAAGETASLDVSKTAATFPLSPGERAGVRASVPLTVVLGFAGTREEVEWQLSKVASLGFTQSASLAYETAFWADSAPAQKLSVLPSKMVEAIRGLNGAPFVARAGNGIIYHRGTPAPRADKLPLELMRRLKDAYDPNHIFPDLPL